MSAPIGTTYQGKISVITFNDGVLAASHLLFAILLGSLKLFFEIFHSPRYKVMFPWIMKLYRGSLCVTLLVCVAHDSLREK